MSRTRHLDARIIAEICAATIARADRELSIEQAVRGLDAFNETEIQTLLARGFEDHGWGVLREVPYPTPPSRRARRAARDRCDIVLTDAPGATLTDAVAAAREEDERAATLFAGRIETGAPERGVDPRDASWIEVKTLGQFTCCDGVPGPNRAYSSELVRGATSDAKKLATDSQIERGWVVVVLFAINSVVAEHDLGVAGHRLLDLGALITAPAIASTPIADRIGNGVCAVWVVGARSEPMHSISD